MGFFTKTVEREVGRCMYCGKPMIGEFREKDGSLNQNFSRALLRKM